MIVLESTQILAAVRKSLESSVLPKLDDDFARVQVAAAVKAIQEVEHRLTEGDPCVALNDHIVADASSLAEAVRDHAPAFAQAIEDALAAAPEGAPPRERNRVLVEGLWALAAGDDPNAHALFECLANRGIESAGQDGQWICPESILSLM